MQLTCMSIDLNNPTSLIERINQCIAAVAVALELQNIDQKSQARRIIETDRHMLLVRTHVRTDIHECSYMGVRAQLELVLREKKSRRTFLDFSSVCY